MFAFIGMPGPAELAVIAIIAVLLFGNKLPGIAKSAGKSLVEFKKGVAGVQDTMDDLQDGVSDITGDLTTAGAEMTAAVKKPAKRKRRKS